MDPTQAAQLVALSGDEADEDDCNSIVDCNYADGQKTQPMNSKIPNHKIQKPFRYLDVDGQLRDIVAKNRSRVQKDAKEDEDTKECLPRDRRQSKHKQPRFDGLECEGATSCRLDAQRARGNGKPAQGRC